MKKILLIALLVTGMMPAIGQITHTAKGAVDKNADQILKKASDKLNVGAVSFTVTMINKDASKKETARLTADVLYQKGKYRVTFPGNAIYCDGSATWHWNKEDGEVVVNPMSSSQDDLLNPGALLKNYSKNFRSKFIREEQNGTAIIDLTPLKSKSYYKIRLAIDSKSGLLKRMELHNYDSTSGEYQVSNFKSGVSVTASDFTFPKAQNPGVEIIDMR